MLFASMLADAAPWYLPTLVLSLLAWMVAPALSPRLRSHPFVERLYGLLPPFLVGGLLVSRSVAILTLDSDHNEVALSLGTNAPITERLQLLLTGYGALEGALLSLLLFALLTPFLPSLRHVSPNTGRFVRSKMMQHNGGWALLCLLLLFPSEAHASMNGLPSWPTVEVAAWNQLLVVVLFTFLIIMSGELLTASSHFAQNNEMALMFRRAVFKTCPPLFVAWWVLFQADVFSQVWWTRPQQEPMPYVGLLVAACSTLMLMYHAPATVTEGRFHHHSEKSRTMVVSLVAQFGVVLLVTWKVVSLVDVYGEGAIAFSTAWKLTASLALFTGVLMFLPNLGYDAAHRPEAWWTRAALLLTLAIGSLLDESVWLLIPGMLLAATLQLHLPWLLEGSTSAFWSRAGGLVWWAVVVLGIILAKEAHLMLWYSVLALTIGVLIELSMSRTLDG